MQAGGDRKRVRKAGTERTQVESQLLNDLDELAQTLVASSVDMPLVDGFDALRVQADHRAAFHQFLERVDMVWRALVRNAEGGDMVALLVRLLQTPPRALQLVKALRVRYDGRAKKDVLQLLCTSLKKKLNVYVQTKKLLAAAAGRLDGFFWSVPRTEWMPGLVAYVNSSEGGAKANNLAALLAKASALEAGTSAVSGIDRVDRGDLRSPANEARVCDNKRCPRREPPCIRDNMHGHHARSPCTVNLRRTFTS